MLTLLVLAPWILTVIAFLVIIIRKYNRKEEFMDQDREHLISVAVHKDKAYWVYENVLYESNTVLEPDFETARPVDTNKLNSEEVKELMEVLDQIKASEGDNS